MTAVSRRFITLSTASGLLRQREAGLRARSLGALEHRLTRWSGEREFRRSLLARRRVFSEHGVHPGLELLSAFAVSS